MYQPATPPEHAQATRLGRIATILIIALAAAGLPGCDEKDPTGTELTTSTEGGQAGTQGVEAGGVTADATATNGQATASLTSTLPLPINQSVASSGVAFGITQTGGGPSGLFKINSTLSAKDALLGQTNGFGAAVHGINTGTAGNAGFFESTNAGNANSTIFARAFNVGNAGVFLVNNVTSKASAVVGQTTGVGPAIVAIARTGAGGTFSSSGKETLLATNTGSGAAIHGVNTQLGNAAAFENVKSTNGLPVLAVTNRGGGFAAVFGATTANGKGVLIQTQSGAVGLQVVNGTKNAVVATPSGAKALYTEESTEVWFTDYGFGKLEKGRARILFDPSFAQTINPDEPYHVFLQPRGRAELYVGETTPLGFEVALKDGDPNAEFSYRIVARRLGFEQKRLERAPWADQVGVPVPQSR